MAAVRYIKTQGRGTMFPLEGEFEFEGVVYRLVMAWTFGYVHAPEYNPVTGVWEDYETEPEAKKVYEKLISNPEGYAKICPSGRTESCFPEFHVLKYMETIKSGWAAAWGYDRHTSSNVVYLFRALD